MIRVYLTEKVLDYELIFDYPWKRKYPLSEYQVFSDIPALIDLDGIVLEGWYAIVEHIENSYPKLCSFLGTTAKEKSETRRLVTLFNSMFFAEVTQNIVFEKVIKRHVSHTAPDSALLRKGSNNLKYYFDYISWLIDRRNWLAGANFSFADIAAASQISCIDYVGSVKWDDYPILKDWYVRIKSRPSFKSILMDRIPTINPPDYYQELDF
jgi:glutathione S-transferase